MAKDRRSLQSRQGWKFLVRVMVLHEYPNVNLAHEKVLRTESRYAARRRHFSVYLFTTGHIQDILKVSGIQVSPVEIEDVLLAHPKRLITDATVAGVNGGRTSDEKVPRAWVVLSDAGKRVGGDTAKRELEVWHQENLSKYKWLRGGIEVVQQVRTVFFYL